METTKTERIEIDLPQDIIFAILLFQERSISLGKATELTEISRVRFMEVLKEHDIPAYEYGEKDFEMEQR